MAGGHLIADEGGKQELTAAKAAGVVFAWFKCKEIRVKRKKKVISQKKK